MHYKPTCTPTVQPSDCCVIFVDSPQNMSAVSRPTSCSTLAEPSHVPTQDVRSLLRGRRIWMIILLPILRWHIEMIWKWYFCIIYLFCFLMSCFLLIRIKIIRILVSLNFIISSRYWCLIYYVFFYEKRLEMLKFFILPLADKSAPVWSLRSLLFTCKELETTHAASCTCLQSTNLSSCLKTPV